MSFNNIINRQNLTLVQDGILNANVLNVTTVEERDALENLLIDRDAREELALSKLMNRNRFSQLNVEQETNQKAFLDLKIREIVLLEKRLLELTKDYYNKIEVKKLTLISKTNELRKKLSIISKINNKSKFIIKEDFINLYNIDNSRNNKAPLSIDTASEVATLPIVKTSKIGINKILISKETNGIPGNYNTGKNKLIYNLIDENPDTCFEIFKVGTGPLKVKLILDFNKEEIINEFVVGRMNINGANSFEIKSVVYTDILGRSKSLELLIDTNKQRLTIDSYSPNDELIVKHLPVKATRVALVIESKEYTNDKIFSLGIKNLEFYLNSYQEEGEVSSNVFQTPEGLYSANFTKEIFPKAVGSYEESFKISTDKGGEFFDATSNSLILDGKSKELIFNYNIKRINSNIENVINDVFFVDVKKHLRTVNRNISPISYALNDFNSKTLKVIQPKILSRKNEGIPLGTVGNTGKNTIALPYNLNKSNIKRSEIKLYMNGDSWINKENESLINQPGEFYVRENGKEIVVFLEGGNSYLAKLGLSPVRAKILKKPEGYYTPIEENFDYDKDEIRITSLYGNSARVTETLPKEEVRFFLKEENIDPDSFELYILENNNWVLVQNREAGSYELNSQDGILYYLENIDKERKCIYKYFKEKELNKNEYEIWAKENEVKGLYFYDESIYVEEISQKLKTESTRSYNSINKEYEERRNIGSTAKSFVLKYSNIIDGSLNVENNLFGEDVIFKEVKYENGYTEFLNLEFMENDPVPNIEKNNLNQVSFTLLEIPYDQKVKVFKGEVEVNTSVILNGRICTLTLLEGDLSSKGYSVEYYYKGEDDPVKKFSVDYENGVLYTEEEILDAEKIDIEYSVADVYLEYDIYKNISNFEIRNGIVVYTEEFLPINNKVKFIWFSKDNEYSLEGLEKYYSPIIYSLSIGMN
jgi:hypothetical protein